MSYKHEHDNHKVYTLWNAFVEILKYIQLHIIMITMLCFFERKNCQSMAHDHIDLNVTCNLTDCRKFTLICPNLCGIFM